MLIECPGCKRQISVLASSCPHCGFISRLAVHTNAATLSGDSRVVIRNVQGNTSRGHGSLSSRRCANDRARLFSHLTELGSRLLRMWCILGRPTAVRCPYRSARLRLYAIVKPAGTLTVCTSFVQCRTAQRNVAPIDEKTCRAVRAECEGRGEDLPLLPLRVFHLNTARCR